MNGDVGAETGKNLPGSKTNRAEHVAGSGVLTGSIAHILIVGGEVGWTIHGTEGQPYSLGENIGAVFSSGESAFNTKLGLKERVELEHAIRNSALELKSHAASEVME